MRLSIIIPIYNTLPYIEKCLGSVISQLGCDDEIILVDDGSTDGSGKLCDRWAAQYNCIRVLHQANAGQNAARLAGLAIANGEFVAFVDSDDYVGENYFACLVNALEEDVEVDIAISAVIRFFPSGDEISWFPKAEDMRMLKEQAAFEMFRYRYFGWHLWGRIYRRSLFADWHPPLDFYSGEDLLGNWYVLRKVRCVEVRPKACYYYRQHSESVVHRLSSLQLNVGKIFRILLERDFWPKSQDTYEIIVENYIYACISQVRELILENQEEYEEQARVVVEEIHDYAGKISKFFQVKKSQLELFSLSYEEVKAMLFNCYSQMAKLCRLAMIDKPNVYVYGTGLVASSYAKLFEQQGVVPVAYVVSDGQPCLQVYKGRPVIHLSEVSTPNQDTCFLLAVGPQYADEISEGLKERGYENIWSLPATTYGVIFEGLGRG